MCLGKAKENVPRAGDHFTHVGVLDEAPGLELAQRGMVAMWGGNQQIQDRSLFLPLCNSFNKYIFLNEKLNYHILFILGEQIRQYFLTLRNVPAIRKRSSKKPLSFLSVSQKLNHKNLHKLTQNCMMTE